MFRTRSSIHTYDGHLIKPSQLLNRPLTNQKKKPSNIYTVNLSRQIIHLPPSQIFVVSLSRVLVNPITSLSPSRSLGGKYKIRFSFFSIFFSFIPISISAFREILEPCIHHVFDFPFNFRIVLILRNFCQGFVLVQLQRSSCNSNVLGFCVLCRF